MSLKFAERPPARLVFEIRMEGSARKVITVRSALCVDNQLDCDVEVRMTETQLPTRRNSSSYAAAGESANLLHVLKHYENEFDFTPGASRPFSMVVATGRREPIPLPHVHLPLFVRPTRWSVSTCDEPITWTDVRSPGETRNYAGSCSTVNAEKDSFKFVKTFLFLFN